MINQFPIAISNCKQFSFNPGSDSCAALQTFRWLVLNTTVTILYLLFTIAQILRMAIATFNILILYITLYGDGYASRMCFCRPDYSEMRTLVYSVGGVKSGTVSGPRMTALI